MRIILAHSHANTFGGGERVVLELARLLAGQHDVRLLLGGFELRRTYPDLARFRHQRVGRLQWPLLRVAADAIVTNSFGANLLALRNGARVVYWVHSTRSIFLMSNARRVDLALRRVLDWLAVRRAALLVANSRYTANQLWRLYGRDADAVVYPGVDLQLHHPAGSPDYVEELRSRAPAGVVFRGQLAPAAVAEVYRGAALAVFTPHGEELGI